MQVATTPHSQAVSHEAPSCKPAERIIEMGETRGMQGDVLNVFWQLLVYVFSG